MRWLAAVFGSWSVAAALVIACTSNGVSPTAVPSVTADDASTDVVTADDASADVADSGAAGAPDDRIMPLSVGRRWTYEAVANPDFPVPDGGAPTTCVGEQTTEVVGLGGVYDGGSIDPGGVYNGGTAMRFRSLCLAPALPGIDFLGTGDRLVEIPLSADARPLATLLFTDTPIEDGHTWDSSPTNAYKWVDAGTATVKGGAFTDCWKRQDITPDKGYYEVFCRGVGQVQFHEAAFDAELTSKNF